MLLNRRLRAIKKNTSPVTGGIVLYSQSAATVGTQTTYSIRVPDNVSSIAGLAIGAGGGGGGCSSGASAAAGGGGGGALSYSNSIAVTPGETLTVLVPNQSASGSTAGGNGGTGLAAQIRRSATVLLSAAGGSGSLGRTSTSASAGALGGQASAGVGDVKYSGGTGGAGNAATDNGGGGGSAAGYAANGVTGGAVNGSGIAGAGGSGGSGASYNGTVIAGSGGGTLWYGVGSAGAGGSGNNASVTLRSGKLGSSLGGRTNIFDTSLGAGTVNDWGLPGGAGGGAPSGGTAAFAGMRGAGGAVRILWGENLDYGNPSSNVSTNSVSYKAYTTSATSSITLPSVELGDTVIIIDYSENTSGIPTAVTPTGFTIKLNVSSTTRRLTTYVKQILSSAESGTVLTCANGTAKNAKFAIVISGSAGASYSPKGTDATGSGAIGVATAYSNTYTEASMDGYANGSAVGFLFFNSTGTINPTTDMTYDGSTTIPGPDSNTYVKLRAYPVTTTSLSIPLATSNLGTNTYNFWITKFF